MSELDPIEHSEARELTHCREFAIQTAETAGEILLSRHRQVQTRSYKSLIDFKTQVDDELDKLIRQAISEQYPNHSIYSEELPSDIKDSEWAWVYDPLDGTYNFTNGIINLFSVSIGLCKGRESVMGVVNAAKMGELYFAQKGEGAYMNGKRIWVSETADIQKAMVAMDFGKEDRQQGIKYYNRMLAADGVGYPSVYACTSVSIAQVAIGRLDAYLSIRAEPWDYAGAVSVAREAGARVTTLDGKEWELGDESILVANPELHRKLLEMFSEIK
jgi:myo-inositol-1(or 4)-monophosphatase